MKGGTAGNTLSQDMFVSRSCFVESAGALTLLLVSWFVDSFAALSYAQSLEVARIRARRCVVSGLAQHSSLRCQSALRLVVASGVSRALCAVCASRKRDTRMVVSREGMGRWGCYGTKGGRRARPGSEYVGERFLFRGELGSYLATRYPVR